VGSWRADPFELQDTSLGNRGEKCVWPVLPGSLPAVRLERKIGRLSNAIMAQVKTALVFALDLEPVSG
jgi:hypothetical protein